MTPVEIIRASVALPGMKKTPHQDRRPRPCNVGIEENVGQPDVSLIRRYLEITHAIAQQEAELCGMIYDMLAIQQAMDELVEVHDCLEHQDVSWIVHEDEDSYHEEPFVTCKFCGEDITNLVYGDTSVQPEEYHPEERFS